MGVYLYPNNTETELKNAYIGIPNPESIVLDKSSISLTTIGQTEQLTATIEPTISDKTITWTTSDSTVATVSTTGLVTCVTPGTCTITATTVNGLTATCGVSEGWQPGANTLAYYPLTSTTTTSDESGNGNTLTNRNVSFGTYQGVSCASFNGSSSRLNSTIAQTPQGAAVRTVLWYCYNNHATYTEGADEIIFVSGQTGSTGKMFKVAVYNDNNSVQQRGDDYEFSQTIREQRWCGAVVYDGTKFTFYVNGVSQGDWTNTPVTSGTSFYIGGSNTPWWRWSGYISNVIFENKARTAQEISEYYDQTKSNYGL